VSKVSPEELERRKKAKNLDLMSKAAFYVLNHGLNPARQKKKKAMREEGLSARQYRKRLKAERRALQKNF
jgi:hypothetical protein